MHVFSRGILKVQLVLCTTGRTARRLVFYGARNQRRSIVHYSKTLRIASFLVSFLSTPGQKDSVRSRKKERRKYPYTPEDKIHSILPRFFDVFRDDHFTKVSAVCRFSLKATEITPSDSSSTIIDFFQPRWLHSCYLSCSFVLSSIFRFNDTFIFISIALI